MRCLAEIIRVMTHVMKCHYEVLEVERNADDATLKKQYRKLALKVVFLRKSSSKNDYLYLVPPRQEP